MSIFVSKFVNIAIHNLVKDWPEVAIINGRARHHLSQGLVDKAKQRLKKCWLVDVPPTCTGMKHHGLHGYL